MLVQCTCSNWVRTKSNGLAVIRMGMKFWDPRRRCLDIAAERLRSVEKIFGIFPVRTVQARLRFNFNTIDTEMCILFAQNLHSKRETNTHEKQKRSLIENEEPLLTGRSLKQLS